MNRPMKQVLNQLTRKPKLVRLHQAITVSGAVHAEVTLATTKPNMAGIEFEESQFGVVATIRNKMFMIPWPNVAHVEYESETDNSPE